VQHGDVELSTSLAVGVVRLTERFLRADPSAPRELLAAATYVRELLPALEASSAIGTAGTVTQLAALDLGLVAYDPTRTHSHLVSRDAVEAWFARLAEMTVAERLLVPGLEPGRAPVIVAGVLILREILDAYGLVEIEASEHDILDGAALAAAELAEREEGAAPPGAYTCC
jgi:exopolyphosphatase/guanosine-5'-triphosphate,3'-diphosphate pyrophosphatase